MQKLNLTGTSKHQTDDQMKGLSAVFLDGDEVFIDNGAIHAKSRLEVGVKFVDDQSAVPDARHIQGLWITLKRQENGLGYAGAMPFDLWIDDSTKMGYKKLSEQVNQMDKAVRGQVDVQGLPREVVNKLGAHLQKIRPDLWENASDSFRQAFSS
ncbi:YwhD family protein [Alicyclobacillus dauci]|uniref:YwhD family protein n=1 Tax=Alicyclobacillus dauci TaxID=1475485 RepID=A0ABY6Z185_9BACL|nr:YwhD family protein [Alicyclobacillus dauci]WAH35735.1 YwhD family protein [Alicyclobacillus dauci]